MENFQTWQTITGSTRKESSEPAAASFAAAEEENISLMTNKSDFSDYGYI